MDVFQDHHILWEQHARENLVLHCNNVSWKNWLSKNKIQHIFHVLVVPYLNGPAEKEVKDTAGSDVKLTCDVIGYPIRYEWRDDKKSLIGTIYSSNIG
jgi:hypothetical protein